MIQRKKRKKQHIAASFLLFCMVFSVKSLKSCTFIKSLTYSEAKMINSLKKKKHIFKQNDVVRQHLVCFDSKFCFGPPYEPMETNLGRKHKKAPRPSIPRTLY